MISIEELMRLGIANFELVVNNADLDRVVSNVVILEYESDTGDYSAFSEGDFVLTSLFFAKNDPDAVLKAFTRLVERDISAVAVKKVYYDSLPENVIAFAESLRLPVFVFEKTYMEDIILYANEAIKNNLRYLLLEQKVEALSSGFVAPEQAKAAALDINPDFAPFVSSVYFERTDERYEDARIFRLVNKLLYRKNRKNIADGCTIIKYKKGAMAFIDDEYGKTGVQSALDRLFSLLDGDHFNFRFGVSAGFLPLDRFDVCVQQCVYAFGYARIKKLEVGKYENLGVYSFVLPLAENKSAAAYYRSLAKIIADYDKAYNSGFMETLVCYVNNKGDVSAVSAELHQHQNTVRYRLQRAKTLLGLEDDFQLREIINMVVKLGEVL